MYLSSLGCLGLEVGHCGGSDSPLKCGSDGTRNMFFGPKLSLLWLVQSFCYPVSKGLLPGVTSVVIPPQLIYLIVKSSNDPNKILTFEAQFWQFG